MNEGKIEDIYAIFKILSSFFLIQYLRVVMSNIPLASCINDGNAGSTSCGCSLVVTNIGCTTIGGVWQPPTDPAGGGGRLLLADNVMLLRWPLSVGLQYTG